MCKTCEADEDEMLFTIGTLIASLVFGEKEAAANQLSHIQEIINNIEDRKCSQNAPFLRRMRCIMLAYTNASNEIKKRKEKKWKTLRYGL